MNNSGRKFGGRKPGVPNKATSEIRNAIQLIVENNIQQLDNDLATLEPKDRIKAITDLAAFVLPKLKATDLNVIETKEGFTPIEISFKD